ncbi:hypothetical protein EBZ35_01425 [bacterium]|nr:hypothetical protein [bacterium]
MRLFIPLLIAFVCLTPSLTVAVSSPPSNAFLSERPTTSRIAVLGLTLILPTDWTLTPLSPTVVGLYSPDPSTTGSITRYTFSKWSDASQIRKKRETSLFDGWIVRQSRLTTPSENRASQADSREVVVYAQQRLSSDNKVVSNLMIEHYMTKGLRGYAISIRTTDSQWTRMEQTIKSLIRSIIL